MRNSPAEERAGPLRWFEVHGRVDRVPDRLITSFSGLQREEVAQSTSMRTLDGTESKSVASQSMRKVSSMVQDQTLVASLQNPSWAESSVPDEEAVIHSLRVDAIVDLDGDELAVDLVQRDDLCVTDSGVAIVRDPAWIRVAGVRVSLAQALNLARLLISANEIAEPQRRRELGAGSGTDLMGLRTPNWRRLPSNVWEWRPEAAKVRFIR